MIPVVPIGFVGPVPDFPPPQRASDADRDTAVDMLCAAVADGRLALPELDERVAAALSARTLTELAALIADLPSREPSLSLAGKPPAIAGASERAAGDRPPSATRAGASDRATRDRPVSATRWSLLQSLAAG